MNDIENNILEMNTFTTLAKLLKQLNVASKKILDASLKLMKQIQDADSEFVDDLIDSRGLVDEVNEDGTSTINREELLNDLQQASLGWTDDAESVRREIDSFIVEEDDVYTVNADSDICPFLTEVWNGDSYDKTGVEGLKALLDDLNLQLEGITGENLVERATHIEV